MASTYLHSSLYGAGGSGAFPWPPAKQPALPLPRLTSEQGSAPVWSVLPYKTQLPPWAFSPPSNDIIRMAFSSTRVPGIVLKPGMAGYTLPGGDKTLVMDLDLARYRGDEASWRLVLAAKQATGITHLQVSPGFFDELGWSIEELVKLCRIWKEEYGGFCDIWVLGATFQEDRWSSKWGRRDADWSYFGPIAMPWLEALADAGVCDGVCLGWQLDGYQSPLSLMSNAIGLCAWARARGVKRRSAHWVVDANAWWDGLTAEAYGIRDRFTFWAWMLANDCLNTTYFQCDVNAPIVMPTDRGVDGMQPGLADVMRALNGPQRAVALEYAAQDQFDNPTVRTRATGALRGRLILCAAGRDANDPSQVPAGYGCDAWADDGRVI